MKKKLIGTWKSTNYQVLHFSEDGNFVDTVWSKIPYQKKRHPVPLFVIEGKYSAVDGIVYFYDAQFNYLLAEADYQVQTYLHFLYPRTVRFENEDIFMQDIQILEPLEESQTVISGKWKTESFVLTFVRNNQQKFQSGVVEEEYEFLPDTNLCRYSRDYKFNSLLKNISLISEYDYDKLRLYFHSRELELESMLGAIVTFSEGKLILFHSDVVLFRKAEI